MCIKIPYFKGIYAVLSRIWKCLKPRSFGANFSGPKLVSANFYAFCNYSLELILLKGMLCSDSLNLLFGKERLAVIYFGKFSL